MKLRMPPPPPVARLCTAGCCMAAFQRPHTRHARLLTHTPPTPRAPSPLHRMLSTSSATSWSGCCSSWTWWTRTRQVGQLEAILHLPACGSGSAPGAATVCCIACSRSGQDPCLNHAVHGAWLETATNLVSCACAAGELAPVPGAAAGARRRPPHAGGPRPAGRHPHGHHPLPQAAAVAAGSAAHPHAAVGLCLPVCLPPPACLFLSPV